MDNIAESKPSLPVQGYSLLVKIGNSLQSPFLLVIRLYWGWQFFLTGKGKLMKIDKITNYFASLHIPMPALNAHIAGCTECFGGLLLLIGLGTRLISIPMMFLLGVAYVTADPDRLKAIFSDPDKFVTADEFLFLMAVVIVFVFGPGKFSADWLLGRMFRRPDKGV